MKLKHQAIWFCLACLAGFVGVNLIAPIILPMDFLPSGFLYLLTKNVAYAAIVGTLAAWLLKSLMPSKVLMWIGIGSFVLPMIFPVGGLWLFTDALSHVSTRTFGKLFIEGAIYGAFAAIWWALLRVLILRSNDKESTK